MTTPNDLPSVGTEDARSLADEMDTISERITRYSNSFGDGVLAIGADKIRKLVSERDALAGRVAELEAALKEAIVIIDGALYCGHELNITGKEKLSRCRAALSLDTHHAASEPVAYLVTGPYVKQAFPDFSGASAFCSGLNEGFDEAAYIVRPLYTTPESKP